MEIARVIRELGVGLWLMSKSSKAAMIVEGVEYEILIASDCDRDSMQFECYRGSGDERELLVEVVRYDGQKRYAFAQYVPELPLALVEYLAGVARQKLGPFFVG